MRRDEVGGRSEEKAEEIEKITATLHDLFDLSEDMEEEKGEVKKILL